LEADAISAVVSYFNWERSFVISGQTDRAIALENALGWKPYSIMSYVDGLE
jgi:hypothetical protein